MYYLPLLWVPATEIVDRRGCETARCNSDRRLYPEKTYEPCGTCPIGSLLISSAPFLADIYLLQAFPNIFERNCLSICLFLSFSRAMGIFILLFLACVLFFLFCLTPCSLLFFLGLHAKFVQISLYISAFTLCVGPFYLKLNCPPCTVKTVSLTCSADQLVNKH